MEAIVLAGGLGRRLSAVVSEVPKPMAPVAGKPFLEYPLRNLFRQGVRRVILSVGYKADVISAYFGREFGGLEIIYSVEEHPLGTGGAVRKAMALCREDHALVLNGDTYLDVNLPELEKRWREQRQPLVVAQSVPDTARYGRLTIREGRVVRFGEKAGSGPGEINVGCYLFPREMLDAFPLGKPFSLEADFLAKAVEEKPIGVFRTHGLFIDIGVPEDYARAQTMLSSL